MLRDYFPQVLEHFWMENVLGQLVAGHLDWMFFDFFAMTVNL